MTEVWLQEEGSKGCNSKACKPVASRSGDQLLRSSLKVHV